jgi:hypothetical protein
MKMKKEDKINAEEAMKIFTESYARMAKHALDIAYARRTLYEAYISEGFSPQQALELCKTL